jgi:hypothetical protein
LRRAQSVGFLALPQGSRSIRRVKG